MPDLATHAAVGYLASAGRSATFLNAALWGSLLPDLVANAPVIVWNRTAEAFGFSVLPNLVIDALTAFHAPVLLAGLCWLIALLLPERVRRTCFAGLLLGGMLHVAADLLQWHLVPGAYVPAFPLSGAAWEAGLFNTEASIRAWPYLAAVVALRSLALRRASRVGAD